MMRRANFLIVSLFWVLTLSYGQEEPKFETLEYRDLAYLAPAQTSNDNLQRLSLVLPKGKGNSPTLVWIGGGAWSYVNHNMELDFAHKMAQQGIAVASIGHRLSPAVWRDPKLNTGVQHPKHIEDVASAVKWLCDNAETYGLNLDQFFIGGYSSGAHLAALLCMDAQYLQHQGLAPSLFKGVIPFSGAYDMEHYHTVFAEGNRPELAEQHVEAVFGSTAEERRKASPTNYLDKLATPMLLVSDNTIFQYTKHFEERLRELEFNNIQVSYSYDLSHGELWQELSFAEDSFYRKMVLDFIRRQPAP